MKSLNSVMLIVSLGLCEFAMAQHKSEHVKATPEKWTVYNRNVTYDNDVVHLDAGENDGLLWINGKDFKNGTIELDIKGENAPGQSFVGVAFHGMDNRTFDAVYFRPFNFKNTDRNFHSIQYVSLPENDWSVLRKRYPGKYEHTIIPVPDPDGWFHAKIVVHYPEIKVFVNDSEKATLEVQQISTTKQGKIGIWVGNGSEGWFKNFTIINTGY